MGVLPLLVTLFMVFFFRDPERTAPPGAGLFLAPADGKVIFVDTVREDRYLKAEAVKVSIFMSAFDVHVNRAPFGGIVREVVHRPGRFMAAYKEEASLANEHIDMVLDTSAGPIVVRQVAGLMARRAVCRVKPGDRLESGERYGVIKFGSRVDLYLPKSSEIRVKLNARTTAGETVIGVLNPALSEHAQGNLHTAQ